MHAGIGDLLRQMFASMEPAMRQTIEDAFRSTGKYQNLQQLVAQLDASVKDPPTGSFVRASQEIMYGGQWPSLARWSQVALYSIVMFAIGAWVFDRLSPRFAEEL